MNAPFAPWFQREGIALLTDLYELTMMAGYLREHRPDRRVSFEYFFRTLPPHNGFAIVAGLDSFLDYLEHLRFSDDDIAYLRTLDLFSEEFFDMLRAFRPSCTVRAMAEGTLAFPHEPIVQVEGTIFEAQLVESALLNMLNFQTLIATKAARICLAADGEPVLEFGLRRAHGPDGAISASRAAHIGGCTSTSNVLAGRVYGIPVSGTHAHSWVMSFESELEAFRAFARNYPERCVLLVDTYDTIESGVPNAIAVFKELREKGVNARAAIRLDSGDLAKLSKQAHRMITEAGLENPLIVASNDLEEDLIADLKRQGAKINAWGVGTRLVTSWDCPSFSGVYKLVAIANGDAWQPRIKISSNVEKATDPGRKQVVRHFDAAGRPVGDVLYDMDEDWPSSGTIVGRRRTQPHLESRLRDAVSAEPLLQIAFANGRRIAQTPPIHKIRDFAQTQIASLPEEFKRLRNPEIYRVMLSRRIGVQKDELLTRPDLS
ncbi:MAG TPA: nicotinate phosphoribosyltransferase [Candidatus Hydrogenedentes bacterium]|nr:nicotinate phosphoribosyltransferase [Candidatus Hydrogenedentota bacterium]HOS01603.1 nicotinate phosphoribosyltransferase [Candidatus Hydrogenedentota bacterium]